MKIGKLKLSNNLILAPMAGVTDIAYRILCLNNGAGLVYSEMINANALVRNNKATHLLTQSSKEDFPVAMQLFGTKIDVIKKSIEILEKESDIIDFNLGCPDKNVIKQGAGSALLKRPAKVKEIVEIIRASTDKSITFKIRSGFNKQKIPDTIKISKIIEKAGADALTIHPRTMVQGYKGKSDWNVIKAVKDELSIPVIGNGDIRSEEDAKKMLDQTGCDLLMIGRAAMGDPFIFDRINYFLDVEKKKELPTYKEKIKIMNDYFEFAEKFNLNRIPNLIQKAQMFCKELPGSAKVRLKLNKANSKEEIFGLIKELS